MVTLEIIDQVTELTVEETVINLSIEDKIIQLEVNPAGVKGPMGPVGNAEWGLITGTLSDQLDLQTELDTKADVSHVHAISDINALQDALDDKADNIHTHEIADVNSLQTALDNKSNLGHTHSISGVIGLQTALDGKAPLVHNHDDRYYTESETDTLLNGKANANHTHAISDVTNLQSSLDGKAAANHNHDDRYYTETEIDTMLSGVGSGSGDMTKAVYDSNDDGKVNAADTADSVAWTGVTGKPATFTPSAHTHPASDVTGLATVATSGDYDDLMDKPTLGTAAPLNVPASGNAASGEVVKGNDTRLTDARTPTTHNHDDRYYTESEIDTALAGKANSSHTHTKSDITDFAHTHNIADVTGLSTALADKADDTDIATLLGLIADKADSTHTHDGLAPSGGSTGQVLKKVSNTDYDYSWQADNDTGGGGGVSDGDKGDIEVISSGTIWTLKDQFKKEDAINVLQALGSSIKAEPIFGGISFVVSQVALTSQQLILTAVWLPTANTLTGVKWWQANTGAYTASNYNGVGLYTYSGGTLTLVASSTNDGNIWKQTSAIRDKAFSATYVADAGLYFIGAIYSASAATTVPQIGAANGLVAAGVSVGDFTNSAKYVGVIAGLTALPASQAMSGVSTTFRQFYFSLY